MAIFVCLKEWYVHFTLTEACQVRQFCHWQAFPLSVFIFNQLPDSCHHCEWWNNLQENKSVSMHWTWIWQAKMTAGGCCFVLWRQPDWQNCHNFKSRKRWSLKTMPKSNWWWAKTSLFSVLFTPDHTRTFGKVMFSPGTFWTNVSWISLTKSVGMCFVSVSTDALTVESIFAEKKIVQDLSSFSLRLLNSPNTSHSDVQPWVSTIAQKSWSGLANHA